MVRQRSLKKMMKLDESLTVSLKYFYHIGKLAKAQILQYLKDKAFDADTMFSVLKGEGVFVKIDTQADGTPTKYRYAAPLPTSKSVEKLVDKYSELVKSGADFAKKNRVPDNLKPLNIGGPKQSGRGPSKDTVLRYNNFIKDVYNKQKITTAQAVEIRETHRVSAGLQSIMCRFGILLKDGRSLEWSNEFFPSVELATYLLRATNTITFNKEFTEVYVDARTQKRFDPATDQLSKAYIMKPKTEPAASTVAETKEEKRPNEATKRCFELLSRLYNMEKAGITSARLGEMVKESNVSVHIRSSLVKCTVVVRRDEDGTCHWNQKFFPTNELADYVKRHAQALMYKREFTEKFVDEDMKLTFDPAKDSVELKRGGRKKAQTDQADKISVSPDTKVNGSKVDINSELAKEFIKRGDKEFALKLLKGEII